VRGILFDMNVTFRCPHCDHTVGAEFEATSEELACPACKVALPVSDGIAKKDNLWQCLVCHSKELFVRKDFSQRLGVTIVVTGIVVSSIFWALRMPNWTYGVLFATALIDVVLYFMVGNVLQCYRCQAQYRGVPGLENHGGFDLETHEKHRQQRLRLAQQAKPAS
jgi:hypothetical protein